MKRNTKGNSEKAKALHHQLTPINHINPDVGQDNLRDALNMCLFMLHHWILQSEMSDNLRGFKEIKNKLWRFEESCKKAKAYEIRGKKEMKEKSFKGDFQFGVSLGFGQA